MITCVFGKRGEGKTHFIKQKIILPSFLPVIIIDTLDEYQDSGILIDSFGETFNAFKVRFVPEDDADFNDICRSVSHLPSSFGINFVVSEVDFWTSSSYLPPHFLNCLRYSRHYKLNVTCDVRSPSELNRKISALADRFIIFKTTEPRYVDYFLQYNRGLEQAAKLKTHEYLEYDLHTAEVVKRPPLPS